VDFELKLFVKGKLQTEDNTDLPETDYTAVINNLLHSLFSQCTISLNGTQITQATKLYPYRACIKTLSTYGNNAANAHLTMPFWLLVEGNMLGGDCSKPEQTNNGGFCSRWNRLKQSQTIDMYGRLHSDICNVPLFLLNGDKIQIKLTKAKKLWEHPTSLLVAPNSTCFGRKSALLRASANHQRSGRGGLLEASAKHQRNAR